MTVQFGPTVALLVLTSLVSGFTAVFLRWNTVGSESRETLRTANYAQVVVLSLIAVASFGQVLAVATEGYRSQLFGMHMTLVGGTWMAPSWFAFALLYTGREDWVTRRSVSLLVVLPLALTATLVVDTALGFGVVLRASSLGTAADPAALAVEWGPGTWAMAVEVWGLCVVAIYLLFRKFLTSRNVYRKIAFFHVVGGLVLNVGLLVSLVGLGPFEYLSTGFVAFSAVILVSAPTVVTYRYLQLIPLDRVLSMFGRRWQNLTPMARDTVIQRMGSGVVVVDHENRVVDVNPPGRRMLGAPDSRVVGKRLRSVVPDPEEWDGTGVLDPATTDRQAAGAWIETPDGGRRCFDVDISPLGPQGEPVGRLALLTDVTDRERRKEKLERRTEELEHQNERLDQFASVVSHDLRNPLTVARGHLEGAKALEDGRASIEEAERSLDRMESIIEDVLTLAREGESIGETEPVSLELLAREAWDNVETTDADLIVADDPTFEGDPDRLLNLFENLFRNSVEHGSTSPPSQPQEDAVEHGSTSPPSQPQEDAVEHAGPTVTVTVGSDPAGSGPGVIYVADDGPGIPEDEREDVLSFGYTTEDDGTGFGLAIVGQVAEAHGWDLELTESASGGARFEFHGVDFG